MRLEHIASPRVHRIFLSSAVLILSCAAGAKLATLATDDPGLLREDGLLGIRQQDLLLGAALAELAVVASVIRLRNSFQSLVILAWFSSLLGLYRLGSWWVGSQGCACFGRFEGNSPAQAAFLESFAGNCVVYLLGGSALLIQARLKSESLQNLELPAGIGQRNLIRAISKDKSVTKVLVAAIIVLATRCLALAATSTNIAEQFKAYIAKPPPIESVVFWIQPLNEAAKTSTHGVYYACWQSNAFVLRKLHHPDDVNRSNAPPSDIFCGRYESKHWRISQRMLPGRESVEYADVAAEPQSADYYKAALGTPGQERMVECYVLSFGLATIVPGTAQWQGNQLVAQLPKGRTFRGELTLDQRGLPRRVISDTGFGFVSLTEFEYQGSVGSEFIPNTVTLSTVIPPEKQPAERKKYVSASEASRWGLGQPFTNSSYRVHFLSMQVSDRPLSKEHFMPDRFIKNDGREQFKVLYTNSWSYMVREGRLEPTLRKTRSAEVAGRTPLIWAGICVSIGFLFLMWSKKREQQKQQTKGRP